MGYRWSPIVISRSGLPLFALAVGFGCGSPWILNLKIGRPLWSPAVVFRCDLPLWAPAVGFRCGPPLVSRYVVSRCGVPLWSPAVGSRWTPAVVPCCGLPLLDWPPLRATAGRALPQRIPYTDPPKNISWGSPSFGVIGFYISKTTSGPPQVSCGRHLGRHHSTIRRPHDAAYIHKATQDPPARLPNCTGGPHKMPTRARRRPPRRTRLD